MDPIIYNYNVNVLRNALNPNDIAGILKEKALRSFINGTYEEDVTIDKYCDEVRKMVFDNFPEKKLERRVYLNKIKQQKTPGKSFGIDCIHIGVVVPKDINYDTLLVILGMTIFDNGLPIYCEAVMEFSIKQL